MVDRAPSSLPSPSEYNSVPIPFSPFPIATISSPQGGVDVRAFELDLDFCSLVDSELAVTSGTEAGRISFIF
ncbi:hypothetical protein BT69DRAFT_1281565 [Atractiella rhizophila]|nr:hypothetical protein BT69DRAFT_1288616 [Atractiella rhizophila]KAH8923296.1 hypothetical protein BT69DRAFT_1281565 [Atractiella rhizophila]